MRHVILRPGNIYGRVSDPLRPQGVIEHWMHNILRGAPLHIWGNEHVVRDYVHVDDLVRGITALLRYSGTEHVFNVGTGVGTSLGELMDMLREVTGNKVSTVVNEIGPDRISVNILDGDRLKKEAGFVPQIKLRDGLQYLWNELLGTERNRS